MNENQRKKNHRDRKKGKKKAHKNTALPKITLPTFICVKCQQEITDLSSALSDKQTQEPVHFDCVLSFLQETETLEKGERIIYIGQGKFAVAHFKNPHSDKDFSITRLIEWEDKNHRSPWRSEVANQYSQIEKMR